MAQGGFRGASRLASQLFALMVGLELAPSAGAFPIAGGVQWNFVGRVTVTGDAGGCCQPTFVEGESVTGSLVMRNQPTPSGAPDFSAGVEVTSSDGHQMGAGGSVLESYLEVFHRQDGVPGQTPDEFAFGIPLVDSFFTGPLGLQPGWIFFPDPSAYFELVAPDGAAWSGINPRTGDIFPDRPPDISHFSSAFFVLGGGTMGPAPAYASDSVAIRVDITRFVPEPGLLLAVSALALVLLPARRSR